MSTRDYTAGDWPHGLRCTDCESYFAEGDPIFNVPFGQHAFVDDDQHVRVSKIVCEACALGSAA
jgi:hypothetical protein